MTTPPAKINQNNSKNKYRIKGQSRRDSILKNAAAAVAVWAVGHC